MATSLSLLSTLVLQCRGFAMPCQQRGVSVEALNAARLAAPPERRLRSSWSQEIRPVVVRQMTLADVAGRSRSRISDAGALPWERP